MSNRWIPSRRRHAPYALLGGFEPAGDHSILPWTAGFLTQATALRR